MQTRRRLTAAPGNMTRPHEEHQYLELVREILEEGEHRPDRTGTGTYSVFAPRPLKFSLNRDGTPILPLLTTKRVFLKAVVAELLWFIEANTSSLALSEAGVKIWDGNGSREFLDSVGLSHREGVDQLADVIDKLKNKPYDRRIIMSAWNPKDLKSMALPPCHMFAQFYRSCDMGLGVPFNIASYALLTHMLAHVCDLVPGSLTHVMGDAHVYLDHIDALEEQMKREPRDFPELEMTREKGGSIDGWKAEEFVVKGYNPHKSIPMKMSV
ncbi:hypothetical protein ACCO45_013208 [Purpureocillium lilacinum]|uniref:Uncharacterized protein n=1 Tax=Purpureocillium lilacinum TaxID=33203 RepID=A0ACC4DA73_PURLI